VTLFTPEDRAGVRKRLLDLASADDRIVGAALTGSAARDDEDRWSDVDVFLGVSEDVDVSEVLAAWTHLLYEEFDALHHWDVASGTAIYRVFLLANCLQVDVAFTPESSFGARGTSFRVLFGNPVDMAPMPSSTFGEAAGLGWLGILHANAAIRRG
jgi:predicted nucleotidyltransferase